jgi:hypothetical protein
MGAERGSGAAYTYSGCRIYTNEFLVLVGDTAWGRKGTVWEIVRTLRTSNPRHRLGRKKLCEGWRSFVRLLAGRNFEPGAVGFHSAPMSGFIKSQIL